MNYNAILTINNNEITVDGAPVNQLDLLSNELSVTFLFADDAYNLDSIKQNAFGGRMAPSTNCFLTINDIKFDIIGYGAVDDKRNEVSFHLFKI